MAKNRRGQDRHGRDRSGPLRPGEFRTDRRSDPTPSPADLVPDAPGAHALDAHLRATVSAPTLDAGQPAAPTDLPVAPPPVPAPAEPTHDLAVPPIAESAPRTPPAPVRPPAVAAIGATLVAYVQGEGVAALAHLRALGTARSPAEAIHLQFDEMQRAAEATLTCWDRLARDAGRLMSLR